MHLVLLVGNPRGACKQASKVKGAESWVRDREMAFRAPYNASTTSLLVDEKL